MKNFLVRSLLPLNQITAKSIVEALINYGWVDDIVTATTTITPTKMWQILKPMIDSYLMHCDVSYFTNYFQQNSIGYDSIFRKGDSYISSTVLFHLNNFYSCTLKQFLVISYNICKLNHKQNSLIAFKRLSSCHVECLCEMFSCLLSSTSGKCSYCLKLLTGRSVE